MIVELKSPDGGVFLRLHIWNLVAHYIYQDKNIFIGCPLSLFVDGREIPKPAYPEDDQI